MVHHSIAHINISLIV